MLQLAFEKGTEDIIRVITGIGASMVSRPFQNLFFIGCFGLTLIFLLFIYRTCELLHVKSNNLSFAPSKDSDEHVHLPILIRIFALQLN